MTMLEQAVTIALCALGTMATRFLPFLAFSEKRRTPQYVQYLGKALPGAVFALLVVYCLRGVNVFAGSHGIPEAAAIAVTALLHLKWRNTLLSIACGTAAYMLLIRVAFPA